MDSKEIDLLFKDIIKTMRNTKYNQVDFDILRRDSDEPFKIAMQDYNDGLDDAIRIVRLKYKEYKKKQER